MPMPPDGSEMCSQCASNLRITQKSTFTISKPHKSPLSFANGKPQDVDEGSQQTIIEPVAAARVNDMPGLPQKTMAKVKSAENSPPYIAAPLGRTQAHDISQEDAASQVTMQLPAPSAGEDLSNTKVADPAPASAERKQSGGDEAEAMPIGSIVNQKYKIVGILGKGGLGVVYKVEHLLLPSKKIFALKVLHTHLSQNPQFRKRFIREVEVAMEFAHEHAVQIRDFGETEEHAQYFTMDFCQGVPLRKIMDQGPLSEQRALDIARQVLSALQNAHAKGIVHRDLKPENIMVEDRFGKEHAQVLDFGIAKILTDEPDNKITGYAIIGTPLYMSPEQASGEEIDARTDLYAMGVMLYEMVTGKPPFHGSTREIIFGHMLHVPTLPSGIKSGVSLAVENLITKAMAKKREDRFASAEEFIAAIAGLSKTPQTGNRLRAKSSHLWRWIALSMALGGFLLAALWWWQNNMYADKEKRFAALLQEHRFTEAEHMAQELSAGWLYRDQAGDWRQRLAEAQAEYAARLKEEARAQLERQREVSWQEAMTLGKKMLVQGNTAAALDAFTSAEKYKKESAAQEFVALEYIVAGLKAQELADWQTAVKKLQEAQEYCQKTLPDTPLPFLTIALQKCQAEWLRLKQDEERQRTLVANQFAALHKNWQEKDWPAIAPLMESLAREKLAGDELKAFSTWQTQYPPLTMEVFNKNVKQDPWQKAGTVLLSNALYQIRMQFKQQLYAYGFQQESSGKIQSMFPKNEQGLYSFVNPIKPGEYYIPSPGAAFRLDRQVGYEHFYLLYSNLPLKNPERLLDDHLASRKKYPMMLILTFEHK
jgi:serine/threonine protein kinase